MLMAEVISSVSMYSSAVCERDDCPGPIFIVVKSTTVWFEVVG